MPVLINFKICDNAKDCSGVAVCKTGALFWDDKERTLKIDNTKCISCGLCEKACMTNSIRVAKNQEEYKLIKKEIEEDPRKIGDLFVDRYGAEPVDPAFITTEEKFQEHILEYDKLSAVEFYNSNSIRCLLKSIPIKELIGPMNIRFRKLNASDKLVSEYKNKNSPRPPFL